MTSRRRDVTPDAPVGLPPRDGRMSTDPMAALWALLPSAEQLRSVQTGPTLAMSAHPDGPTGQGSGSLDVPSSLLNIAESLPRPLSLDDVKRIRDGGATGKMPAD